MGRDPVAGVMMSLAWGGGDVTGLHDEVTGWRDDVTRGGR